MKRIVKLRERKLHEAKHTTRTIDLKMQWTVTNKVLEVCGEICEKVIDPNAEEVDHTGPTFR